MSHLYLIRHGEAFGNVEPILPGMKGDRGLTPRGVMQAERLRDRLLATQEIKPDVVIASTLPRARQTAEIIAPAFNQPIIFDDDVQELNVGEADGMAVDAAWAKYGLPDFDNQPLRPLSPGGEGWGQFMLRVGSALERITQAHVGKTIVIVCHGGVIDGSFVYFMRLPSLCVPPIEFNTHNTSITHWEYLVLDNRARWRLGRYNDTVHLQDIGATESIRWSGIAPEPITGSDRPSVPIPTEE